MPAGRNCDPADGLRYLLDRAEIADLVHTYALNIRDGNGRSCRDLFVDDAVFEMYDADGDGIRSLRKQVEGRNAIIDHISGSSGTTARICPMIHNLVIRIDGDRAESSCTMTGTIVPGGSDFIGAYEDWFQWDGAWRFTKRAHTILLHRASPQG